MNYKKANGIEMKKKSGTDADMKLSVKENPLEAEP